MKTSVCLALAAIAFASGQEIDDTISTNSGGITTSTDSPAAVVCDGVIACDSTYDPVCTTKGTFRNWCEFKNSYCERPSKGFRIVPCGSGTQIQTQSVEDEDGNGNDHGNGHGKDEGEGKGNDHGEDGDEDDGGEGNGGVSQDILDVPIDIDDVTNPMVHETDELQAPFVEDVPSPEADSGTGATEPIGTVPNDPETPLVERSPESTPYVLHPETPLGEISPEPTTTMLDAVTPIVESVPPPPVIDCTNGSLACDVPDDPVCASNGFTYTSECQFKNAYCEAPSDSFVVVHKGPCDSSDVPLQVQSLSVEEQEIWGTVFNVPVELNDHHKVDCEDGHLKCSNDHAPVCASDGSTFRNECEFKNAYCERQDLDLHIVSREECPPMIHVQSTLDDGVSVDVLNVPVELDEVAVDADINNDKHRSQHPRTKVSAYCTLECPIGAVQVAPICGTDSRSYINDCHLLSTKCEQPDLEKQYDGLCTILGQALRSPTPDAAMLATQEVTRPSCNAFCGRHYAPVCGSNGVTYANPCLFEFAHCQNPHVTQISDGECAMIHSAAMPDQQTPTGSNRVVCVPSVCPSTEAPVCGSDGQTYHNHCLLNNARCVNADLSVAHDGECGAETKLTCATLTCPRYTKCKEDPVSQLAHCADVCHPDRCGPNETCELLDAVCYTAPCSPVATCLPNGNAAGEDF